MDLMQTASLNDFETRIIGSTSDYKLTAGRISQLLQVVFQENQVCQKN